MAEPISRAKRLPRIGRAHAPAVAVAVLPPCSRCGRPMGAFLTLAQAAACLSVPLATLQFWVYGVREIKVTHVGRAVRVLHHDINVKVRRPA